MRRFLTTSLLAVVLGCSLSLRAQLRVTRQVLATTVQSATPPGNDFLKFTAHAGELLTGTNGGGILVTTGFQQPDDDITVSTFRLEGQEITVTTYPNPTASDLTVELGSASTAITELSLHDLYGRQLLLQPTNLATTVLMVRVGQLPSGTYFLRARTTDGQLIPLSRVMVVPH